MNSIKKYDNIIMFTNGSIGDFLMGMLCADSAREKLGDRAKIIILAPRNASLLKDLSSAYPHIQVIEISRHRLLCTLAFLLRVVLQENLAVYNGVLGESSHALQFLFRSLARRRGSTRLYFLREGESDKHKEGEALHFDYRLSVYENLARLFNTQHLGISSEVPRYHFILDTNILGRYHLARSGYIVVHPCASSPVRSLPPERWAKIFAYVSDNFPNTKIVVTGSKQDAPFIQKIFDAGARAVPIVNLAGRLTIMELANIIEGSQGYLGVDTGITHLAGILQKRSVIIGNLSNPHWLPFYNKNSVILTENKNCTCDGHKGGNCFYWRGREKYYKCMMDVPEESIYKEVKDMLSENNIFYG